MPLPKLNLRPDSSGYSVKDGADVIFTELDGGAGRYTRDKWGATSSVDVSWTLNPLNHQYLRAFYNTVGKTGAPFLCDLILDDPFPIEHVCRFVPGTMNLGNQQGYTYVSSAQFEVEPILPDLELDNAIIELFAEYGDDTAGLINLLEQLVNVNLPEIQP